jgi:hypothetical protein
MVDYAGLEDWGARNVFNCRVDGLEAGVLHEVEVYYAGKRQATRYYQPIRADARRLRFVTGGDIGDTFTSRQLTKEAAALKPDVVMVGGDLAYDNNIGHCYYTWDRLFHMLDLFSQVQQRLVPYIMAVGNHDVGLNELPGINITVDERGPAYHIYMPQHSSARGDGVPALSERRTFFAHKLGPVLFVSLDSGYLHEFGKEQE